MNRKLWEVLAGLCLLAMSVMACAQTPEVKEKPPMYSYVGNWNIPRAHWAEMDKQDAADQKVLDKAIADGTIVAYGNDINLVHQADGFTHDDWWSAMSMAGLQRHLQINPALLAPHGYPIQAIFYLDGEVEIMQ